MNELIEVKNRPLIDYSKMQLMSEKLQSDIQALNLDTLVVNEDTVKDIKKLRTSLRKEHKELEDARKALKKQIEQPYTDFMDFYRPKVGNIYTEADKRLKQSIDKVENDLKIEKRYKLENYLDEVVKDSEADFLTFDMLDINVTLSATEASLMKELDYKIDNVYKDLELINSQENKVRILRHYQKSLDLHDAITKVTRDMVEEQAIRESIKEVPEEPVTEEVAETPEPEVKTAPAGLEHVTLEIKGYTSDINLVIELLEDLDLEYNLLPF